jgi:hypothetical protein
LNYLVFYRDDMRMGRPKNFSRETTGGRAIDWIFTRGP